MWCSVALPRGWNRCLAGKVGCQVSPSLTPKGAPWDLFLLSFTTAGEDSVISRTAWLGPWDGCSGPKEEVSAKPVFWNKAYIRLYVISYTLRSWHLGSEGRKSLGEVNCLPSTDLYPPLPGGGWRTAAGWDILWAGNCFSTLPLSHPPPYLTPTTKIPSPEAYARHLLKTFHGLAYGVMAEKMKTLPALPFPTSLTRRRKLDPIVCF